MESQMFNYDNWKLSPPIDNNVFAECRDCGEEIGIGHVCVRDDWGNVFCDEGCFDNWKGIEEKVELRESDMPKGKDVKGCEHCSNSFYVGDVVPLMDGEGSIFCDEECMVTALGYETSVVEEDDIQY